MRSWTLDYRILSSSLLNFSLRSSKRAVVLFLAAAMFAASAANAAAPLRPVDPAKLKHTLRKRGIGMAFKVKELDGTRVTGVLTAIHDDTFEIAAKGTTQALSIPYAQVAEVHNDDGHSSVAATAGRVVKGAAIGAGAVAILVVVLALFALHGG